MSDIKQGKIVSTNGKTADIRLFGSNTTYHNIPITSGSVDVGQTVHIETIDGKKVILGGNSETSGGNGGGSYVAYNSSVINVTNNGVNLSDMLASATYRADRINEEKMLKARGDGWLAVGRLQIGNSQLTYSPKSDWRSSNLVLQSADLSSISFSTLFGTTGITSEGESVSVSSDFGFGNGITNLSGNTIVSPFGAVGAGNFPLAPLTGYGDLEQLRLIHQNNGRFASFTVDEYGNLFISPQNRNTDFSGVVSADAISSETASISRLRTGSLLVDRQSVLSGETIAAERGAFIAYDFTVPEPGQSTYLYVYEPQESTVNVFTDNAWVAVSRIVWTDSVHYSRTQAFGKVKFRRRLSGAKPGIQEYVFERDLAQPGLLEGETVVSCSDPTNIAIQYGTTSGIYLVISTGTANPNIRIFQWTDHPLNASNKLRVDSSGIQIEDLKFTPTGIETAYNSKLFWGFNGAALNIGLDAVQPEAADLGGSVTYLKAWDHNKTHFSGIKFSNQFGFQKTGEIHSNYMSLFADGGHFIFQGDPVEFHDIYLPSVAHPSIFGPWLAKTHIGVSSRQPTTPVNGDFWLLNDGWEVYTNNKRKRLGYAAEILPAPKIGLSTTIDNIPIEGFDKNGLPIYSSKKIIISLQDIPERFFADPSYNLTLELVRKIGPKKCSKSDGSGGRIGWKREGGFVHPNGCSANGNPTGIARWGTRFGKSVVASSRVVEWPLASYQGQQKITLDVAAICGPYFARFSCNDSNMQFITTLRYVGGRRIKTRTGNRGFNSTKLRGEFAFRLMITDPISGKPVSGPLSSIVSIYPEKSPSRPSVIDANNPRGYYLEVNPNANNQFILTGRIA